MTRGVARGVLLLALAASCGRPTEEGDAGPRTRVVLVGDSITAGRVSAPEGPSYAELLPERLGPGFAVTNLGCGGTSSLDWTRSHGAKLCGGEVLWPNLYVGRVRPALPAEFVTVLLGTNDSAGLGEAQPVTPESYGEALAEITSDLLADGAERVVLLGPPMTLRRINALLLVAKYGDAIREVCASSPRVICGPDLRYLLAPEDFAPGNVHPNGPAHVKIADALAQTLLALAQAEPSSASASGTSAGDAQTRSAPAASSSERLP